MMRIANPSADTPTTLGSIAFLLIPGFSLMSYAAAVEPLRAANLLARKTLYRWWHAAPQHEPIAASSGTTLLPDVPLTSDTARPDLVLVCAGGNPAIFNDRRTFAWLRRLATRGSSIGGISGGPYILAKAGLLRGRRCTVHWEHMAAFEETFPDVHLTRSLFEIDSDRITCSGGVAALDMMLALIMRDHGAELSAAVCDWLLHARVRDAAGPQRMELRFRLGVRDERVLSAVKAMEANLEAPLRREQLAELAGTSIRQLERVFRRYVGHGVHAHYLTLRLARARQLLQESALTTLEIALATGFASASQFSRAFKRTFGHAPRQARHNASIPFRRSQRSARPASGEC